MEIKFISLPSIRDLQRAEPDLNETKLRNYEAAQFRIMMAQRKAAVIAAEILRPDELRHHRMVYRDACAKARSEFEDKAVGIFSETCTRGL